MVVGLSSMMSRRDGPSASELGSVTQTGLAPPELRRMTLSQLGTCSRPELAEVAQDFSQSTAKRPASMQCAWELMSSLAL